MVTYQQLEQKYNNFIAPTIKISLDGKEIIYGTDTTISDFSLDLSTGFEASGCSFVVYNEYLPKESDFDRSGVFKSLQIGAKVEIELGYVKTSPVFTGLVTSVQYLFEEDGESPCIQVYCMDAKCLLMKTQRLDVMGEQKLDQAIKDMLSAQPASSYLSSKKIDSVADNAVPLHNGMLSDYEFVVAQAQYFGCEFFVTNGTAFFRVPPNTGTATVSLGVREGILSANVALQSEKLVNKVTVTGVDPMGEELVSASQSITGTFSQGNTAKKMLGESEMVFYDPYSIDATTAGNRAKSLLNAMTRDFGVVACTCMGIPELVPGEFVKLSGLMKEANGTFYISAVKHIYSDEGYTTIFEARFHSL